MRVNNLTMSISKLNQCVLSRIAGLVVDELNDSDLTVTPLPEGFMIFGESHLELLQQLESDRIDDVVSLKSLIELSKLVDCIQVKKGVLQTPVDVESYLSDVFPNIIERVDFNRVQLSNEEQNKYDQAKELIYEDPPFEYRADYEAFLLLRADYNRKKLQTRELMSRIDALEKSDEKDLLGCQIAENEELVSLQKQQLDDLDNYNGYTCAEDLIKKAERKVSEIPQRINSFIKNLPYTSIVDAVTLDSHVPCRFIPSQLSTDNWLKLDIDAQSLVESHDNGELNEIKEINIEIQTLFCERPWLWDELFYNKQWRWDTRSDDLISSGEGEGEGLIPGYIVGVIFARNIRITFKPKGKKIENVPRLNTRKLFFGHRLVPGGSAVVRDHQSLRVKDRKSVV